MAFSFKNTAKNNQRTIMAAFWLSVLTFGAAALTVLLWPAALAALVNISIFGFSLAVISTPALQSIAIGAIAACATSLLTFATAGIVNGVNALMNLRTSKASKETGDDVDFKTASKESINPDEKTNSASSLSTLGSPTKSKEQQPEQKETKKSNPELKEQKDTEESNPELREDGHTTLGM